MSPIELSWTAKKELFLGHLGPKGLPPMTRNQFWKGSTCLCFFSSFIWPCIAVTDISRTMIGRVSVCRTFANIQHLCCVYWGWSPEDCKLEGKQVGRRYCSCQKSRSNIFHQITLYKSSEDLHCHFFLPKKWHNEASAWLSCGTKRRLALPEEEARKSGSLIALCAWVE